MLVVACLSIYLEIKDINMRDECNYVCGYLNYSDVVDVNVIFPPVIIIA